MISCRTLTCAALVPKGQFYCDACGGVARAKTEGLLDPKKEAKKTAFKEDSRGAVPVGQGLARFTDSSVLAERARRKREKRAKIEAARKALRVARGPKKQRKKEGKGGGDGDGKKGKKNKPDKGARKAAKNAAKQ